MFNRYFTKKNNIYCFAQSLKLDNHQIPVKMFSIVLNYPYTVVDKYKRTKEICVEVKKFKVNADRKRKSKYE